jgi:hypothetical protein
MKETLFYYLVFVLTHSLSHKREEEEEEEKEEKEETGLQVVVVLFRLLTVLSHQFRILLIFI